MTRREAGVYHVRPRRKFPATFLDGSTRGSVADRAASDPNTFLTRPLVKFFQPRPYDWPPPPDETEGASIEKWCREFQRQIAGRVHIHAALIQRRRERASGRAADGAGVVAPLEPLDDAGLPPVVEPAAGEVEGRSRRRRRAARVQLADATSKAAIATWCRRPGAAVAAEGCDGGSPLLI